MKPNASAVITTLAILGLALLVGFIIWQLRPSGWVAPGLY